MHQRLHAAGSVISRLFLASPTNIDLLFDEGMLDNWPLEDSRSLAGIKKLRTQPDTKEALDRDHLYLFTGVSAPLAQPYESPYVTDDGLVFEDSVTLRVRDLYSQFGLSVPDQGRYPDDHIGYEIAFVSTGCYEIGTGNADAVAPTKEMLNDHLLAFAPAVLDAVREHAQTAVYQALPDLTEGFLTSAQSFLDGQ
ncbi:MAG: molecular chaperone TorD family protein [Corynebacterium glucuronolyticum]|nr:molecular chaperone TorD family protein [Corynebacterium glucuronolyticum]MDD7586191.1 molecular chaperone TorD family protein [Mycobacteriaceae bacterium]MDY5834383.1 molecular chaperone TorD family protein [Corynebacterium glucuronolyticum]